MRGASHYTSRSASPDAQLTGAPVHLGRPDIDQTYRIASTQPDDAARLLDDPTLARYLSDLAKSTNEVRLKSKTLTVKLDHDPKGPQRQKVLVQLASTAELLDQLAARAHAN